MIGVGRLERYVLGRMLASTAAALAVITAVIALVQFVDLSRTVGVRADAGIGQLFWLTLLPICGGIGASLALQGSILGAVVFIVLFNVVHLGLRFGLAHYAYRMGVAAIPLIKSNTKKVGHAASIVGMTVIGALVATYVRLNTTLEIKAGDAVVKLQADVIDKLMPAFLPLVYTLTMFWLVRRGWSPLRLIGITVLLGVVGKFCHFL